MSEEALVTGVVEAWGNLHDTHDCAALEPLTFSFWQRRKHGRFREVEAPVLETPVADTHAHLDNLANPAHNLARCAQVGVDFICSMVDVSEDPNTTYERYGTWHEDAVHELFDVGREDLVHRIPRLRIAIGCHPHNAKDWDGALESCLKQRLSEPVTCALGEVGLDYHYDLSPRSVQREVFRQQIRIAKEYGMPLILHMREAHQDGLEILKEEGFPEAGTLLHCCALSSDELAPWIEAGCYVSYGGPITFKSAEEARAGALTVPLTKLLTETDSPYMTPEPMRGMVCGPEYTVFTAARLAEVLGAVPGDSRRAFLIRIHDAALALLDRPRTTTGV